MHVLVFSESSDLFCLKFLSTMRRCEDAGIFVLSEVGLDPGMDHMSAMRIIDDIRARGGKIVSFLSSCGGLPAPEAADNPLQYKFSWSPLGVLRASMNSAHYRVKKKIFKVNDNVKD